MAASATASLADLQSWLREFARVIHEQREELTSLDAAIGDADHGSNMDRGLTAVVDELPGAAEAGTVSALFKKIGMTLVSKVGGASGPLYGTFFLRFATTAGDLDRLDLPAFTDCFAGGVEGVIARGKAEAGDKTMLDALLPALDALRAEAGGALGPALNAAATAAQAGRDATIPLVAHKGRASYLGERSAGHQDPGATSAALLVRAAADTLGGPDQ